MFSGAWVFRALISLILLSLPLPAIALPTDLAPRDKSNPSLPEVLQVHPHYTLSNTGDEAQCIAVPWHSIDTTTSFDNRDNNVVILIESTTGLVLCFIPKVDLDEMWYTKGWKVNDIKYEEIYLEGLLGADGELFEQIHQLLSWQIEALKTHKLPPFKVLGIQIAAARGKASSVDKVQLIRGMAGDLKILLNHALNPDKFRHLVAPGVQLIGDQPDWKVTVYPVIGKSAGTIAIWKSSVEHTIDETLGSFLFHSARIWISGVQDQNDNQDIAVAVDISLYPPYDYPSQDENHPSPVEHDPVEHDPVECDPEDPGSAGCDHDLADPFQYSLDDPKYAHYNFDEPDPVDCDDLDEDKQDNWVAFEGAEIAYPIPGIYLLSDVEKTVTQLYKEKDQKDKQDVSAQNPVWMEHNSARTTYCRSVLWSHGGSLIGILNDGQGPVLMTQASNGAIICSILKRDWDIFTKKWRTRDPKTLDNPDYVKGIQDIIEPFELEIKDLKKKSSSNVRGGKRATGMNFKVFATQFWTDRHGVVIVKDMLERMEKILAEVVPAQVGSDLTIKPWLSTLLKADGSTPTEDSEWPYSVVWQTPFQKDETNVWIWKVGLGTGSTRKTPLVLLDLSFPIEGQGVEFSTCHPSYFLEQTKI